MIAQLTRNIDRQNTIQNIRHQAQRRLRRRRSGSHSSEIHQRALAQNANRVQNEKRVVAQPGEDARRHAGQRQGKVGVADDLGDGPGDEHGAVGGRLDGEVRVEEEDAPDEEEARGDLHEGCEEGRADDSWCFVDVSVGRCESEDDDCWLTEEGVQNLHGCGSLRPLGEFADVQVNRRWTGFNKRRDGALEDHSPGQGRSSIVEDEVAVLDGGRRRLLGRCALGGRHGIDISD